MNIGTKDVIGAYIGFQKLYKIYVGNNLIYTGVLDTPQNLSINAGEVSFSSVDGASNYDILSDNTLVNTVSNNQFDIDTLSNYSSITTGEHSLTVKANSNVYRQSGASAPVTYNKLLSVSNEAILNDNYSFSEVANADSYNIYADDGNGNVYLIGEYTSVMPSKGDLITMNVDGSHKQFRVLNVNGSVAEVVMMSNTSDSQQFAASGRIYAGSALDTYLNSTWYDTLTPTAKTAIVDKTFTQDSWYWGYSGNPDYSGYYGTTNPGTSSYTISLGSATFGAEITRHVYALSVQDVLDYVLDTSVTDGQLQNYNIWKMFWDITTQPPSTPQRSSWLRSASASSSYNVFGMTGVDGRVFNSDASTFGAVRPAFTIDLSKIEWALST